MAKKKSLRQAKFLESANKYLKSKDIEKDIQKLKKKQDRDYYRGK